MLDRETRTGEGGGMIERECVKGDKKNQTNKLEF